MIRQDDEQFSDPSLRNALRRTLGNERAPATLRDAIVGSLSGGWKISDDAPPTTIGLRARWERWHRVVYASVAACVALFGVMFLVMSYLGYFDRRPSYAGQNVSAGVPVALANAMVERHTACGKLHDHHLIAGNDAPKLKKTLEAQLGYPVAVVMPGNDWVFKGAGRCDVGKTPSAHLLFARGAQEVSVFVLPAGAIHQVSLIASGGASFYQSECNGCPLASAVHGGAMYAAVGSSTDGSLTLVDVVTVRDQFIAALPEIQGDGCSIETPSLAVVHAY